MSADAVYVLNTPLRVILSTCLVPGELKAQAAELDVGPVGHDAVAHRITCRDGESRAVKQ